MLFWFCWPGGRYPSKEELEKEPKDLFLEQELPFARNFLEGDAVVCDDGRKFVFAERKRFKTKEGLGNYIREKSELKQRMDTMG